MKKIFLRKITKDDLQLIFKWRNLEHIRDSMLTNKEILWQEHCDWFDKLQEKTDKDFQLFCIDEKPVGIVSFVDINDKQCSWGFYIGDSNAPKGSGLMLGYYALEYIFNNYNLTLINSQVIAFNKASIAFHKRLFFKEVGVLENELLRNNSYCDLLEFQLNKREWEKGKKEILADVLCKLEERQQNGQ